MCVSANLSSGAARCPLEVVPVGGHFILKMENDLLSWALDSLTGLVNANE